jgi:hypothetical protein
MKRGWRTGRAPGERRAATSGPALVLLGVVALALQGLDLLSAVRMVAQGGVDAELNPLLRGVWWSLGPVAVGEVKIGLATVALGVLLLLGAAGRGRLARNCLVLASNIAAVGVLSNGGFHALTRL